jgi:hypothetical protein
MRATQFEAEADRDRYRRDGGQAVAKSHALPFSIEVAGRTAIRCNPRSETATRTMTVR